ncbi:hypothetical protein [Ferribacterium limneticum]|uniref:hypothetical protein n=1 Tax=Ferribacterium limneticum TaxID=76259 RepID=UPI001CF8715F|nr:hypothetical protein [Ferribacterium limneticum]UCV22860.1 hypothetical protein KI613_20515 [Ferribacterium limneticum]
MGFWGWVFVVVVVLVFMFWLSDVDAKYKLNQSGITDGSITPTDVTLYGTPQPAFVCPHCQEKGKVLTKPIKKKAGISGAKATGAILTGGVSLLATGLSRKDAVTEAHCVNCNSTWHF